MYNDIMKIFCFLVLMSVCLDKANTAGTCDPTTNNCINGNCQLQADQLAKCACNVGFILDPVSPLICNPIPPCNLMPGSPDQQCTNGICLPQQTNGQFSCLCYPGYQLSLTNQNICEDVDECQSPYTGCSPGLCFNVAGDYACSGCAPGYTLLFGKCEVGGIAPTNPKPSYTGSGEDSIVPMWFLIDEILL